MSNPPPRPAARSRPNYLYALISVALVLFLLGFFGIAIMEARHLVRLFKERVVLMVELDDDVDDAQIERLADKLEASEYVKENSLAFISREDAAEDMRDAFGEEMMSLDLPNPFFDVFTFNVKAEYMEADSLALIRQGIRRSAGVQDVYYQESLVDEIGRNIRRLSWVALATGLFFIIVAIALIHNTMRLALYANRFLIKNMELVGASWGFISRPFIGKALLLGLASALLAMLALLTLLYWARQRVGQLVFFDDLGHLGLLFGGLTLLGVMITTLSTFFVVNKYLSMRVDDLY